jgi:hypothetical protein
MTHLRGGGYVGWNGSDHRQLVLASDNSAAPPWGGEGSTRSA